MGNHITPKCVLYSALIGLLQVDWNHQNEACKVITAKYISIYSHIQYIIINIYFNYYIITSFCLFHLYLIINTYSY